ncbi:MAG: TRAP transporter large permease subunit [Syntrophales bacterium]|jgi:tripartite ATP-independent transporter DctM subunit|nr:TRAP transporter large permease subunit [Syntrophales bacterium]
MSVSVITLIIFSLLVILLTTGMPIAFALGGTMVLFTLWNMGPQGLYLIATTANGEWESYILLAIPLFILMAKYLQYSGIAEGFYDAMYKWMGGLRGGLAVGTVIICAVFAAMSGISGAATVAMGLIALPSMIGRGYDRKLAIGTVIGGGSLGVLIPPSIIMVVYGSITGESVGKLFMAGIVPGIMLAGFFILYVVILCALHPSYGPALPPKERVSLKEKIISLKSIAAPLCLVVIVLGVIYFGVCTPTEAAGIGAFAAFLVVLLNRKMTWDIFNRSLEETLTTSTMIMWIVVGAKCFVHIYTTSGAGDFVYGMISGLDLNKWVLILIMMAILFVLGMFLDPIGIMLITLPVFSPLIVNWGLSPIWFGILYTINLEMAYISPPFGLNLFYMKSILPDNVELSDVYYSSIPFLIIEWIGLLVIIFVPIISLWLPSRM